MRLTIAKAESAKETVPDPKAKAKLLAFEKKIANGIAKFLATPMTRGRFIKRSIRLGLTLALLTACGIRPATPTRTPAAIAASPTATEVAPTATATATPPPTETPTPIGPAIPQEMANKYPRGINIEYVGTDRLPLAKDASTGNLIGWYSEKDSAWHFAGEGMQMQYIENFENLGPAVITEVVKTEDATAQTLADWEAGVNVPKYPEFANIQSEFGDSQLFNLVLTNAILENIEVNPGSLDPLSYNRIEYTFAYKVGDGSFYTVNLEARELSWNNPPNRDIQMINTKSFFQYNQIRGVYMVELQYTLPTDSVTIEERITRWSANYQGLATPDEWRFFFEPLTTIVTTGQEPDARLNAKQVRTVTLNDVVMVQVSNGDWQQPYEK